MKLILLSVANGSQPHFSWFSSVVSGPWSVLLHGNFSEKMLWCPYMCLIETLLLLRHFPPPLEFRTLSSVPVSRQQVNMAWAGMYCANISAFTPVQHRHIPSSWPQAVKYWETLSDLSKMCQRSFTQIFMPWQEKHTALSSVS